MVGISVDRRAPVRGCFSSGRVAKPLARAFCMSASALARDCLRLLRADLASDLLEPSKERLEIERAAGRIDLAISILSIYLYLSPSVVVGQRLEMERAAGQDRSILYRAAGLCIYHLV